MITQSDRAFLDARPVGHLATADSAGRPHVLPVCFVVIDETLYITVDQKPKRTDPTRPPTRQLKRVRNILANPNAAVVVDHYDPDWSQLGWIMLRGTAEILTSGAEHADAQQALTARYPQYRAMSLEALPVIALRIEQVTRWGNLATMT